jgi:hypothetical protein
MANTFKFGTNGNWAVKDGYALAYNDENNNFKPLPFDFTRASSATRVNKQGLIETVPSGKPRIDFTDNTSGHLLLEPSRMNNLQRSEEFDNSYWTKTRAVVTANQAISPDGNQTADKYRLNCTSNRSQISRGLYSVGTQYTTSLFVKYDSAKYFYISNAGASAYRTVFDIENGTIISTGSSVDSSKIENYGNGWYRCSATFTAAYTTLYYNLSPNSNGATFTNTTDFSYIWGAQIETGSYATSYIPTEGLSETRVVDDIHLTFPDVDSFNSSSGFSVIAKFDIGETSGSSSVPFLFFNDDSSNTYIGFGSNASNLRCRLNLSGTSYLNTQSNAPRTQRNSLFISCDSSGWSQGANGSTNHTGTNNASVFDRLASITFSTSETYGIIKISELLVYNTRLSNTELQNLTS